MGRQKFLVHFLIFGSAVFAAESGLINVNLNENTPIGSEITRLRSVIDSKVPYDTELEFRIVKQDRQNGLELFDIVGKDGILKLKQMPDRESLCPRKQNCVLELQVRVKSIPMASLCYNKRRHSEPGMGNGTGRETGFKIVDLHCLNPPITKRECEMLYLNSFRDWPIQMMQTNDFEH